MPGRSPAKVPPAPIGFTPVPMDFERPPTDPVAEFRRWFDEACRLPMPNPNAMTLATVDADGTPSARIVLLRGIDERGALFFTNRQSRKGTALESVPRAALLFHWDLLDRPEVTAQLLRWLAPTPRVVTRPGSAAARSRRARRPATRGGPRRCAAS